MTAIAASSVNMKTMADGTLRISFDVERAYARDAFQLFSEPGTQSVLAALKAGTYIEQQAEKPKGGDLARIAGIWCNEPKFWRWIHELRGVEIDNDMQAAQWIRNECGVTSRADLDHSQTASVLFHEFVRLPYLEYLKTL